MVKLRGKFQGVSNVLAFNWPFYFTILLLAVALYIAGNQFDSVLRPIFHWIAILAVLQIGVSILITHILYDRTGLYTLKFLPQLNDEYVLNIHSGFDETSEIIKHKFPNIHLTVADCYHSLSKKNNSIQRAHNKGEMQKTTVPVNIQCLPFTNETYDIVTVIFGAHEIRKKEEQARFIKEIKRVMKPGGKVYILEHNRNLINFLTYSIGFLHFFSQSHWNKVIKSVTPNYTIQNLYLGFISLYTIQKPK